MPPERSAALVVRVWLTDDAARLRARLVAARSDGDERTVAVAEGVDDVVRVVRSWLDAFARGGSPTAPGRSAD